MRSLKKRAAEAFILWMPYGIVWLAWTVWRTFVFRVAPTASYKDAGPSIHRILSSPIHEITSRVFLGIHNILMATVLAWTRPFSPDLIASASRSYHYWAIAAIVVAISVYALRRLRSSSQTVLVPESSVGDLRSLSASSLTLGLAGVAVAGLPFLINELSADFAGHPSFNDRITLPFMVPASLMLLSLLSFLATRRLAQAVLVSTILFLCSAFQAQNCGLYRQDWATQKSLFRQIAWRAPVLKQSTSIFAEGLPNSLYRNHTAGILNLLYMKNDSPCQLAYFIFDLSYLSTDETARSATKLSYNPSESIMGNVRSFQFLGTTSQNLVVWISPSGTLRIVTQPEANEIPRCSALCLNIARLSQPAQVISNASSTPEGPLFKIFGAEPQHQWLYFYQKAELERQLRDWDAVRELGDEVMKEGYTPKDSSEWFPFIDGYTRTHRYRTAADLSNRVLQEYPDAVTPLSSIWLRARREDSQDSPELSNALRALEPKLLLQDTN